MERVNSHNNFYYFTLALVLLLICSALVDSTPDGQGHRLLQGIIILTELVAYLSLNLSRRWRIFVGFMIAFILTANAIHEFTDWSIAPMVSLTAALFFYSGMAYAAARQTLFSGNAIELNTIVGTVAVYLLLGIIWSTLYLITLEFWPNAFNGIEYRNWNDNFPVTNYFSYVTMTTLGYGDISPAMPVSRVLAFLQAIVGTFYMAVVVASMVGAHASMRRK